MKKLSKEEMKKVMGGKQGEAPCAPLNACQKDSDCYGPNGHRVCNTVPCVNDDGTKSSFKMCQADPNW